LAQRVAAFRLVYVSEKKPLGVLLRLSSRIGNLVPNWLFDYTFAKMNNRLIVIASPSVTPSGRFFSLSFFLFLSYFGFLSTGE
jgi:hypothetical protein